MCACVRARVSARARALHACLGCVRISAHLGKVAVQRHGADTGVVAQIGGDHFCIALARDKYHGMAAILGVYRIALLDQLTQRLELRTYTQRERGR